MKLFGKMLKILFNSSEDTKRSSHTNGASSMTETSIDSLDRHHRKLPQVPRAAFRKTFWTTYRTAEHWMAKNHQVLDHTLELLELYPELIKQPTCDKLWDFINRTRESESGTTGKRNISRDKPEAMKSNIRDENGSTSTHSEETNTGKKLLERRTKCSISVPEILVSHPQDEELKVTGNHPRSIYICGNLADESWHRLLVGLSGEYAVRCFNPDAPDISKWLCDTDVFVFLMDDTSVHDSMYRSQLSMAIMYGKTIVYVRDLGFALPDLTTSVDEQTAETQNTKEQTSLTPPTLPVKTNVTNQTVSSKKKHNAADENRSKSKIKTSTVIDMDSVEIHSSPVCEKSKLSPSTRRQHKQSNDIFKTIESEYGTALVYHQLYHQRCLDRIISTINTKGSYSEQGRSVSNSKDLNFLYTPSLSSSFSNDSAIGDMYGEHRTTPEPENRMTPLQGQGMRFLFDGSENSFDDGSSNSSLSSLTETIYIVSPDSVNDQPKIFRFPKDVKQANEMINSPSIDSFDFKDIDLSKRINELDLFEGYLSD